MKDSSRRSRHHHSASFKAEVVAACALPGASVASVALAHGINANLVHRRRRVVIKGSRTRRCTTELAEFVPMTIASPPVAAATEVIRIDFAGAPATSASLGPIRLYS